MPAHAPTPADLERLAAYPHVVVSWVDDDGYPISVATSLRDRCGRRHVALAAPAGWPIPTDREIGLVGSHIHPIPGGYDQRRYLQLWGRA